MLSSLKSCRSPVTYVHKPTLEKHVGSANSMHSWCKKKVNSELGLKTTPTIHQHHGQPTIDVCISNSSFQYYEKLFRTMLYLVEDELPYKLESLMSLQMKNGLRFGTIDKINVKACTELVDVISEVVREIIKEYLGKSKFMLMCCDASEARKTSEEKELIYATILIKWGFSLYFLA